MMRKSVQRLYVYALLLLLSGCGTFRNLEKHSEYSNKKVFGGVQNDIDALRAPMGPFVPMTKSIAFLDLPLSTAADIITLPVTIPEAIRKAQ